MDASLQSLVVKRSAGHCEYCQIPQRFFTELFQIEHIVARQHRGMAIESSTGFYDEASVYLIAISSTMKCN